MLLLAIDTAGPNCAAALARGDNGSFDLIARAEQRIGRGHAELLMPMIEGILHQANLSFAHLKRIAVTTGPGSFTGVRVGIAAARGLSLALDIPAVGIGSLAAIARPAAIAHVRGTIVASLDARRGELYFFAKDIVSGRIVIETAAAPAEAIVKRLVDLDRPVILVGAGATILEPLLPDSVVAGTAEAPDIADVAALGLGEDAVAAPVPLYARGADAKVQSGKAVRRQ